MTSAGPCHQRSQKGRGSLGFRFSGDSRCGEIRCPQKGAGVAQAVTSPPSPLPGAAEGGGRGVRIRAWQPALHLPHGHAASGSPRGGPWPHNRQRPLQIPKEMGSLHCAGPWWEERQRRLHPSPLPTDLLSVKVIPGSGPAPFWPPHITARWWQSVQSASQIMQGWPGTGLAIPGYPTGERIRFSQPRPYDVSVPRHPSVSAPTSGTRVRVSYRTPSRISIVNWSSRS